MYFVFYSLIYNNYTCTNKLKKYISDDWIEYSNYILSLCRKETSLQTILSTILKILEIIFPREDNQTSRSIFETINYLDINKNL